MYNTEALIMKNLLLLIGRIVFFI